MIANKHISKIILAVMAVAIVLCFLAGMFSGQLTELLGGRNVRMEYESKLFDTSEVITIDIRMDEDEWNKMLSNAMSELYYTCDVVINGKKLQSVAIRPKGNTSLSAIAMDADNDRYSLKLEFDHFVEGQTCWGLDKLILNNNYADATNRKEAVVYDMYQYLGAYASLYNYAEVSVNGAYWGVYLALEAVEQSFMLRNFGTQDGELYKPDSMEMGGGSSSSSSSGASMPNRSFGGMDLSDADLSSFAGKTPPSGAGGFPGGRAGGDTATDTDAAGDESGQPSFGGFSGDFSFDPDNMPEGFDPDNLPEDFDASSLPEGFSFGGGMPDGGDAKKSSDDTNGSSEGGKKSSRGGGGFSMRGGGANLNYTDDDLDSYSTIWEGEITGTSTADHRRVVTALKNISEGNELETYLDVDNVLKYMAVHAFSVNMDSLSGSMAHNYYLYEYDGQLNIFPWDYNLSFGGMAMSGDATSVVNDAIDTPFSGTQFFDALLENEEYLARYHAYLQQLVDEYVNGGRFDALYDRVDSQIDALTEADPNSAYTYEEYQTAVDLLYETVTLRAESIKGQLDGSIPSTDAGQRENSAALIDASHIDISAMGQFDMGGFSSRTNKEDDADAAEKTAAETETTERAAPEETTAAQQSDGMPGNLPEGFDPENLPEGFDLENMPDMGGFSPGNMPEMGDFDPENMPDMGSFNPFGSSGAPSGTPSSDDAQNDAETADGDSSQTKRPSSFSDFSGRSGGQTKTANLILFGVCLAVMVIALVAATVFKRRK